MEGDIDCEDIDGEDIENNNNGGSNIGSNIDDFCDLDEICMVGIDMAQTAY